MKEWEVMDARAKAVAAAVEELNKAVDMARMAGLQVDCCYGPTKWVADNGSKGETSPMFHASVSVPI